MKHQTPRGADHGAKHLACHVAFRWPPRAPFLYPQHPSNYATYRFLAPQCLVRVFANCRIFACLPAPRHGSADSRKALLRCRTSHLHVTGLTALWHIQRRPCGVSHAWCEEP
jgi:hypothetical protein